MDDIYFVSLAEPVAHEHYTESTQNPNEPNLLLPAQRSTTEEHVTVSAKMFALLSTVCVSGVLLLID